MGGITFLVNYNFQRVKVYRLNDDGKWDDHGTGHVTVDYLEVSFCLFDMPLCLSDAHSFKFLFYILF